MPEIRDDDEDGGADDAHGGIGVDSTKEAVEKAEVRAATDKAKTDQAAQAQRDAEAIAKDAANNAAGH